MHTHQSFPPKIGNTIRIRIGKPKRKREAFEALNLYPTRYKPMPYTPKTKPKPKPIRRRIRPKTHAPEGKARAETAEPTHTQVGRLCGVVLSCHVSGALVECCGVWSGGVVSRASLVQCSRLPSSLVHHPQTQCTAVLCLRRETLECGHSLASRVRTEGHPPVPTHP
jgi:hypothetical protein